MCIRSISNNESVKALSIVICITHKISIRPILNSFSLNSQNLLEILEKRHLLRVVFGIVFNVLLVGLEILHNIFLLPQLGIEKLRIRLKFICKPFVRLGHEALLVFDSFLESLIYLNLNIIPMIFSLIFHIIVKTLLDVNIELVFFSVEAVNDLIVSFLLIPMNILNFLNIFSNLSQSLDFMGELLLSVKDFLFDLTDGFGDFLEGLVLIVIKLFLST